METRHARPRRPILPVATLFAAAVLLHALPARADLDAQVNEAIGAGSILAYVLVFVGGVLTSLTPCVYPLIPITLSIFGARGGEVSRVRAMALAAAYVGGICVMYTVLGLAFGKAFGTFMASPWFMVPVSLIFLAMAASMFGAFDLNLPGPLAQRLSQLGGAGFGGAFVMGLVGGIIAAPCTGPVLATVLLSTASKGALICGSLLFTYGLGMGMLFFVLAATAASLPRSGAWMDGVKSIFGVVMIVAALYFLRNVIPQLQHYGDWHPWFAAVHGGVLVFGIALGGIHLSFHDGMARSARKAAGVGALVFGVFGMIAWTLTPKIEERAKPVEWVRGEPEAVAKARAEHKPLLLDFSADWCLPCKEMELQVFSKSDVQNALGRFVMGKVDCTNDDDAVTAVKDKYGATTLPTVVLLDAAGKTVQRWNKVIEPHELLEALKAIQ